MDSYRLRTDWDDRIEQVREETSRVADPASGDPEEPRSIGEHVEIASVHVRGCRFLYGLARRLQPDSVLEMGTAVGISASYLAAGMEDAGRGQMITLDMREASIEHARSNWQRVGLDHRIEARPGLFSETLRAALEDAAPVDLVYIDAHKQEQATLDEFALTRDFLSEDGVVVFDDINFSDEMRRVWSAVRRMDGMAWSYDAGRFGVWASRGSR